MKRLISAILMVMLLVSVVLPAFAEDSVRFKNDILFCNTPDDVARKEGCAPTSQSLPEKLFFRDSQCVGLGAADAVYYFSDDGLHEVLYFFPCDTKNPDYDAVLAQYNEYESALTDCFGKTLSLAPGRHSGTLGRAFTSVLEPESPVRAASTKDFEVLTYTERVALYDYGSVKVDHCIIRVDDASTGRASYVHAISFFFYKVRGKPMKTAPTPTPYPDWMPRPTATPKYITSNTNYNPYTQVRIASARVERNSYGVPELYIRFSNDGVKQIDRIDFRVKCYDAYGDRILDYAEGFYEATVLRPWQTSSPDSYWTLYGFSGTRSVEIAVFRYHCTDGTSLRIPDEELCWVKFQ